MKGYCSIDDIKNYSLTEIREDFETQIESWIGQMEEYIDRLTGRNFIADEAKVARYFDGNGLSEMYIDECVALDSVKIYDSNGVLLYTLNTTNHIIIYPYNELPITKIIAKPYNDEAFLAFHKGVKNITIEAKWGHSVDVPELIKFACMVLTTGVVNYGNNPSGEVKSEKVGDYQVTYKEDQWQDYQRAIGIINSYTKHDVV